MRAIIVDYFDLMAVPSLTRAVGWVSRSIFVINILQPACHTISERLGKNQYSNPTGPQAKHAATLIFETAVLL